MVDSRSLKCLYVVQLATRLGLALQYHYIITSLHVRPGMCKCWKNTVINFPGAHKPTTAVVLASIAALRQTMRRLIFTVSAQEPGSVESVLLVRAPFGLLDVQLWLHIRAFEQRGVNASDSLEVYEAAATYKGFCVLIPLHKQPGWQLQSKSAWC